MRAPRNATCVLSLLCLAVSAWATTFHVDPVRGSSSGDGSEARPWRSIQDVIDDQIASKNRSGAVDPNDTILLHDGYHGDLNIRSIYNRGFITVAAAPGETPRLRCMRLVSVGNWRFQGLHLSPSFASTFERTAIVKIESSSSGTARHVVFENCTLYAWNDCSRWSATDWTSKTSDAIKLEGAGHVIRHCHIKNTKFGISTTTDSGLFEHNLIENYSGDGIRGLGDYCTYQYNVIRNNYRVDGNHDDGFQSYSIGRNGVGTSTVRGVVLRGNVFINYVDPDQPFRGTVQGIGCFNGMYEDWLIEHNVIVAATYNGIAMRGAVRCTIRNNTVCDRNSSRPGPPWIRIDDHKNGTPSRDNVVTHNLSTRYNVSSSDGELADNLTIRDPRDWFVDYDKLDMRIKLDSRARGGASDGGDIGAYLFAGQLADDATAIRIAEDGRIIEDAESGRIGVTRTSELRRIGSTVEVFDLQGRCRYLVAPRVRRAAPGTYVIRNAEREKAKLPLILDR